MASTPGRSNADQIAAFLESKGLSLPDVAGILGNLEVESGFDPTASNPREGAIGIAQWEGGRRAALDAYAARTGGSETSLGTQLGYLWSEISGPYSSVLTDLRGTNNPGIAAAYWDVGPGGRNSGTGFENSSGAATGQRMANADAIYQRLISGQSLGGITSAANATLASFDSKTGLAGGAPYDPSSLGSKLTSAQRNAIIAWIMSGPDGGSVSIKGGASALKKMSDKELIAAYKSLYQMVSTVGPSLNPVSAIVGEIETVLNDIAGPIVRFLINAGVVIAGIVAIGIALVMIAKADDHDGPPASPSSTESGEKAGAAAEEAAAA